MACTVLYCVQMLLILLSPSPILKPRPNDRNISTQLTYIQPLSQHCWAQLHACVWPSWCDVLRHLGCCISLRNIVARIRPKDYNILQHHPISTNAAWKIRPFLNLNQQHPTCRNTWQSGVAKRAQHAAHNNVAICYVEMLPSIGRGLMLINLLLFYMESLHVQSYYSCTGVSAQQWHENIFGDLSSYHFRKPSCLSEQSRSTLMRDYITKIQDYRTLSIFCLQCPVVCTPKFVLQSVWSHHVQTGAKLRTNKTSEN